MARCNTSKKQKQGIGDIFWLFSPLDVEIVDQRERWLSADPKVVLSAAWKKMMAGVLELAKKLSWGPFITTIDPGLEDSDQTQNYLTDEDIEKESEWRRQLFVNTEDLPYTWALILANFENMGTLTSGKDEGSPFRRQTQVKRSRSRSSTIMHSVKRYR